MDNDSPAGSQVASVARAYDYLLGGKDNFAADRQWAEAMLERDPNLGITAMLNKVVGRRMVDYLTHHGIKQFVDLGSGIPTSPPSVHETARAITGNAKVIYVDHDPVVVRHNEALRAVGSGLSVIQEDFANIPGIFQHDKFRSTIDLNEPVAVLFLSVFQNSTTDKVTAVLDELRSRVAPGSYLAITHLSDRTSQEAKDAFDEQTALGRYPKMQFRTDEEVIALFDGLNLVPPGLVDYRDWRISAEEQDNRPSISTILTAAVGQYPTN